MITKQNLEQHLTNHLGEGNLLIAGIVKHLTDMYSLPDKYPEYVSSSLSVDYIRGTLEVKEPEDYPHLNTMSDKMLDTYCFWVVCNVDTIGDETLYNMEHMWLEEFKEDYQC